MNEMKFTKGKWKAKVTRVMIGEKVLFSQNWWDTPKEMEEAESNALLISAAPEMFNSLNKCLDFLKRCPMTRNAELEREIETTLNKATNARTTK